MCEVSSLTVTSPPAIVRRGALVAIILVIAGTIAQVVDYEAFGLRDRALDWDTHASAFGAVSLLATAGAAVAAFRLAGRSPSRESLALAVLLVVILALRVVHSPNVFVVSVPFTGAAFILLWRNRRPGFTSQARAMETGLLLLVLSYALHLGASGVLRRAGIDEVGWVNVTEIVLKHGTELAGWVLVTAALLAIAAGTRHGATARHAARPPSPVRELARGRADVERTPRP